ncbi:hypothetical protein OEA41_007586 [Lepraria neglecta]|uniref:Uncharacterized protein n=1 Tax=Lepraria neglecta TaxID=209136 RepID=A0AAE0DN30_9LECA|nr:hypothetical protein OEA41_007586 [Lepraria neglecta]
MQQLVARIAETEGSQCDSDAIRWQTWAQQQLSADPSLTVSTLFLSATGGDTSNQPGVNFTFDTWLFDALNRAFHPTIDGQDGVMSIMLSAYSATPPHTVSNGAFALTSETGVARRTAPVEREDVPVVTPAPKPKAFRA